MPITKTAFPTDFIRPLVFYFLVLAEIGYLAWSHMSKLEDDRDGCNAMSDDKQRTKRRRNLMLCSLVLIASKWGGLNSTKGASIKMPMISLQLTNVDTVWFFVWVALLYFTWRWYQAIAPGEMGGVVAKAYRYKVRLLPFVHRSLQQHSTGDKQYSVSDEENDVWHRWVKDGWLRRKLSVVAGIKSRGKHAGSEELKLPVLRKEFAQWSWKAWSHLLFRTDFGTEYCLPFLLAGAAIAISSWGWDGALSRIIPQILFP